MALQLARKEGTGTPFKFEKKGDSIHGYYQGQVEKTINGSRAIEHTYRTPTGILSVLGQANILTQYRNNGITPGTWVELIFTGQMQKLKGGHTMKVYDVSFDLDNRDLNIQPPSNQVEDDLEPESDDEGNSLTEEYSAPVVVAKAPSEDRIAKARALLAGKR